MTAAHRVLAVLASAAIGLCLGALTSGSHSPSSPQFLHSAKSSPPASVAAEGDLVAQALSCTGRHATLADFGRLSDFLRRFTAAQMGEYLTRLRATADDELTQTSYLFSRWQQVDRQAADEWMARCVREAAQDGPLSPHDYRPSLFAQWARREPEAALAAAERYPWSSMAPNLIFSAFDLWNREDRNQQLAFLQRFPSGPVRRQALETYLRLWGSEDGQAALAAAEGLADPAENRRCIEAVLQGFSDKDPTAALDSYLAHQLMNPELLSDIFLRAAEKDTTQTLQSLNQLSEAERRRCAPLVIASWARTDPGAALSWALQNSINLAESGLQVTTTHTDSSKITQYSTSPLSSTPLQGAFLYQPAATVAYLQQLPPGPERNQLYQFAVTAAPDRNQALYFFSQLPAAEAARVAESLASRFRDYPAGGYSWAASLPAGDARSAAWRGLGTVAPGAEVDLPPGPDRDAMLHGWLFANGDRVAEQSLELAMQISDPTVRRDAFDEMMEQYTTGFFGSQADQARRWMETSTAIPEEWKRPWRQ
jgi:hypothetical protein